jgi:hypothetical protein
MDLLDWMASQHLKVAIFALAASIMLPYPLAASQRPGRGIKPWWTTCRFLSWVGFLAAVFALASGEFLAKKMGLLGDEWILRNEWSDLRLHQYLGGASVFFGYFCLRAVYISRKEHQGLGPMALSMGLLWAVASIAAGQYGIKLANARIAGPVAEAKPKPDAPQAEEGAAAPTRGRLMKILDYASLAPMHAEPVRSAPHKNRWVRVWVSHGAAEAYSKGQPLPPNSLVVMSSVEDRWGRPSHEIGPLYTLEALPGGTSRLGMYWSNVPESKRVETGGQDRVNWIGPSEHLAGCMECHSEGLAPYRQRVRRQQQAAPPRRPAAEGEAPSGG